jgi:hypothetical protein
MVRTSFSFGVPFPRAILGAVFAWLFVAKPYGANVGMSICYFLVISSGFLTQSGI